MTPPHQGLEKIRRTTNWFIYASVILGVALLVQLYFLSVPSFLLYSILAGWILYTMTAAIVAKKKSMAYPLAVVLAIITLGVSLPQPEHYSFANTGQTLALATFLMGSILQVGVIITAGYTTLLDRNARSLNHR